MYLMIKPKIMIGDQELRAPAMEATIVKAKDVSSYIQELHIFILRAMLDKKKETSAETYDPKNRSYTNVR